MSSGRVHRQLRLRVFEDHQGHRLPEPQLRACGGRDRRRRPAVLRAQVPDVERRHPAAEHRARATTGTRPPSCAVRSRTASISTARTRTARPSPSWTAPRIRRPRTGATSTSNGDPEQRAARALELRSGPPHHADGELRHSGRQEFETEVSIFYSGQSGRPYTLTYNRTSTATTGSRTICSTSRRRPTR